MVTNSISIVWQENDEVMEYVLISTAMVQGRGKATT